MKKIVYTRPDSGVSIVNPAPEFLALFATEQEGLNAVQVRAVPADATDVVQVDEANIPADRTFRSAMRQSAGVFSVDMPKAREIHAARIEDARREKARDLIEREMVGEDVTVAKEGLRATNVTAQINAAANPNALKAVWPEGL